MKRGGFFLVAFLTGFVLGFIDSDVCRRLRDSRAEETTYVEAQTPDTVFVKTPVDLSNPTVKIIYSKPDTVFIAKTRIVEKHDTVYVALERMKKHQYGKDYEAWFSGTVVPGNKATEPTIDSLVYYGRKEIHYLVKEEPKPLKNSITLGAAFSSTMNATATVGYERNEGRWRFGVQGGYDFIDKNPVLQANVRYDLFRF